MIELPKELCSSVSPLSGSIEEVGSRTQLLAGLSVVAYSCCFAIFVFASCGCSLTRPNVAGDVPVVFLAPPDLGEVVQAVNANSDRIRHLHSDNVRLSMPGVPIGLKATVDLDRVATMSGPGRFRLSADAMGTRQLDLGSNDEQYWLWVKQRQPPTVFWGYHNQFYQSAAQQFLPMPPAWLIDALGAVHLDRNQQHDGPFASSTPGLLQVRTRIPTPRGELMRILEIDQQRALVVQQQIFDGAGNLLAAADSSDFRHDAIAGVTLPHSIAVKLPPAGLSFDFDVGSYTVNQPAIDPEMLWTVPKIPNHRYLDLANPADMQGVSLLGSATPDFYDRAQVSKPVAPPPPRVTWRDRFGLSFLR